MPRNQLGLAPIIRASHRIRAHIRRTPLERSHSLSDLSGAQVWLKLENLQTTGSFKARGALNKVSVLSADERARGIVTGSAGNHGMGVAFAAEVFGSAKADVFVPTAAPAVKKNRLRQLGAVVHETGDTYEQAHLAAETFARDHGACYIQAYDDIDVIAGQGTVGLEVFEDLPDVDVLVVPVGGGGLIAGVATVAKAINPACRVIGVQPQASPAAWLSLRDGTPHDPYDHQPTIADGLAGGFGATPFFLASTLIDDVLLVDESSLRRAVYALIDLEQMVVEPSGAIAIAPLLDGVLCVADKKVVCILSGRNISAPLLKAILAEYSLDLEANK